LTAQSVARNIVYELHRSSSNRSPVVAKGESADTVTKAAKKLGHLGGLKGGPARARALSKSQRSAIARKGGKARQARAGK
jgi:hypothetical protein